MSYTAPAGNAVDFDFTGAYTPPAGNAVDFAFTDASATPELTLSATLPALSIAVEFYLDTERTLTIGPLLPAVQPQIELARGAVLELFAALPTLDPAAQLQWGETVPTVSLTGGATDIARGYGWGRASTADSHTGMGYNDAPEKQAASAARWGAGDNTDGDAAAAYGAMPQIDLARQSPWGLFAQQLSPDTELPTNYPLPTDLDKNAPWGDFERRVDEDNGQTWDVPPPLDVGSLYPFFRVDDWGERLIWDTRNYTPPARYEIDFDFTGAYTPPAATALDFSWGAPNPYPDQPIRPVDAGRAIPHNAPAEIKSERTVPWGAGSWTRPLPDYEWSPGWDNEQEEPAERPEQPQIKEVYIFMPSITLYRTPDGTEIQASNVSWSTDSDSWAWRFSATLDDPAQLALLKPDSNGPREIACEINGHLFTGMVKGYSPSRSFSGGHTVTISGVSLSGWLSDPHAPTRSKLITAPYNASQLAELELQYTGWTIDWQTQDWLIPAGAYSYESLTPMSAIKRIAEAAGAIVQSHPSDKTLIIQPRYPVSPHKWSDPSTALDAILPADLVEQISAEYTSLPAYNRAIVAGGDTGGVIVTLTRDGTAGDELAPQVTDDLITDQYAGYERGRIEIAKGGAWETVNLTTWLTQNGEAPGLLLPGYLVEMQDTTETYPVQITGTTITAQSSEDELKVRQTLTAERSVTNA